jgi:O-antigen/teichoic acid export membrane protein
MGHSKHYFWSAIGQYGTQALSFIGNVLIARVLSPEDYGLIALLALIIGLANTFTDSGFSDCLIRRSEVDNEDYGTISTFNISISSILYVLIFLTAPFIADYFSKPELIKISRLIGLSVVFRGLALVPTTKMRKELQFKSLAMMQMFSSLLSLALTYYLAINRYGYWALAWQPVLWSLINILYLIIIKRGPQFAFNVKKFREMAGFSLNLLVSYLINQAEHNLYSIVIGKSYPVSSLGFYNQAKRMTEIPVKGLNTVILTTSYPIISNEVRLNEQRKMYLNLFKSFQTVQAFMIFLLIGVSTPLWLFLLGQKWLQSVEYFNLFVMSTLVYPFVTVNSNIIKIQNKSGLYRNLTFFRSIIHILFLIYFARYSLEAVLYGQIAAAYITVLANMYLGGRLIDYSFKKQMILFLQVTLKPFIAFILAQSLCYFIDSSVYLEGAIFLTAYIALCVIIYVLTKDEVMKEFYQKVCQLLKL